MRSARAESRLAEKYGRWAVVTGASDGIGRETALRLAEAGFDLVLVARRESVLEQLGRELAATHHIDVVSVPADLALQRGIDAVIAATEGRDVGLLVAAAGFGNCGLFVASSLDEELAMIDVNCRAVAALAHHFGRRFAKRRRGGIVLYSSLLAFQGVPRAANYAATKAYVQSLAEGLHLELAPFGVDVVASAPGPIHSGFAARAGMTMGMALAPSSVALSTLEALGKRMTVRPGWLSKVLELSLAFLGRWGRIHMLRIVMEGMSKNRPRTLEPLLGEQES